MENQEEILSKMRTDGIGTITVGTGIETSRVAIRIAENNPDLCWAIIGIHPTDIHETFDVDIFTSLANHPKVVAIGETGLDYFRDQSPETKSKQVDMFKRHIELSLQVSKPLMLHVRASAGSDDAYYDALDILKKYSSVLRPAPLQEEQFLNVDAEAPLLEELREAVRSTVVRANFHFFSGSKDCMQAIINAGFTISVDGPITFSRDYDDMIRAVPIEKIMIETDAPFAAPAPHRGKTCEPWMVVEVAKKIAELKEMDLETLRLQLLQNTQDFFGI